MHVDVEFLHTYCRVCTVLVFEPFGLLEGAGKGLATTNHWACNQGYLHNKGSWEPFSYKPTYPDPREDPKSRTPNSGLHYSYGVDRTLGGIYFLHVPKGLGIGSYQVS